ARRAEDRPTPRQQPRNLAVAERFEATVHEPAPALSHADDFVTAVERAPRDSADDRVEPRTIAPAREDPDGLRHAGQSMNHRRRPIHSAGGTTRATRLA